jgi:hypothetical protein
LNESIADWLIIEIDSYEGRELLRPSFFLSEVDVSASPEQAEGGS